MNKTELIEMLQKRVVSLNVLINSSAHDKRFCMKLKARCEELEDMIEIVEEFLDE